MKVYALALAVSLAVLFTAGEGRANEWLKSETLANVTGGLLHEACSENTPQSGMFCIGFIQGVLNSAYDVGSGGVAWRVFGPVCFPPTVSMGQLVEVAKKSLLAHPERWHYPASDLVAGAMEDAFSCY